ncbi:MAG: hypothetical protein WBM69_06305 [Desulfobacterales bacterium]
MPLLPDATHLPSEEKEMDSTEAVCSPRLRTSRPAFQSHNRRQRPSEAGACGK